MGTNAAPELANFYLLYYEFIHWNKMLKKWRDLSMSRQLFLISYKRYIDDIWVAAYKWSKYMKWMHKTSDPNGIFPSVLRGPDGEEIFHPLQLTGEPSQLSVNFLDVSIKVNKLQRKLTWILFDKRDGLKVNGVKLSTWRNFPHVNTMLANSCKMGVITSQLFRFNRRTSSATNFISNAGRFIHKMVRNGYNKKKCVMKASRYMQSHWTPILGKLKQNMSALKKRLRKIIVTQL